MIALGMELGAMFVVVLSARFGATQTDVIIYLILLALLTATLCASIYYRAQRKEEAERLKRRTEVEALAAYAKKSETQKATKSKK